MVTPILFPQAHTSVARSYSHTLLAAVLEGMLGPDITMTSHLLHPQSSQSIQKLVRTAW